MSTNSKNPENLALPESSPKTGSFASYQKEAYLRNTYK